MLVLGDLAEELLLTISCDQQSKNTYVDLYDVINRAERPNAPIDPLPRDAWSRIKTMSEF